MNWGLLASCGEGRAQVGRGSLGGWGEQLTFVEKSNRNEPLYPALVALGLVFFSHTRLKDTFT